MNFEDILLEKENVTLSEDNMEDLTLYLLIESLRLDTIGNNQEQDKILCEKIFPKLKVYKELSPTQKKVINRTLLGLSAVLFVGGVSALPIVCWFGYHIFRHGWYSIKIIKEKLGNIISRFGKGIKSFIKIIKGDFSNKMEDEIYDEINKGKITDGSGKTVLKLKSKSEVNKYINDIEDQIKKLKRSPEWQDIQSIIKKGNKSEFMKMRQLWKSLPPVMRNNSKSKDALIYIIVKQYREPPIQVGRTANRSYLALKSCLNKTDADKYIKQFEDFIDINVKSAILRTASKKK